MKEPTPPPRHQLRLLAEVLIYKLYASHLDDTLQSKQTLDNIHQMFSVPVSRRLIESALSYLRTEHGEKTIIRSGSPGSYVYKISSRGIIFTEYEIRKNGSLINYYSIHGDAHLDDVAGFDAIYSIEEDNDEPFDDWMPVTFNKSSDQYKALISSVTLTIEAVKTDNELGANFPHQKEELLESLESGKARLEKGVGSKQYFIKSILSPIKWILSNFAKNALNAAATTTIHDLVAFIKAFFS